MHLDLVDFHTITLPDRREFIYVNIPRNSSQVFFKALNRLKNDGILHHHRDYCYVHEIDKIKDWIGTKPVIGFLKDPYIRFESIKRVLNSFRINTNNTLGEVDKIPPIEFEDILENVSLHVQDPHTSQQYDQFQYFGDITLFTMNRDLRNTLNEYFGIDLFLDFDPTLKYVSTETDSYSFSDDPRFLERYKEDIQIWNRFKDNNVNILRGDFFN